MTWPFPERLLALTVPQAGDIELHKAAVKQLVEANVPDPDCAHTISNLPFVWVYCKLLTGLLVVAV